MNGTSLVLTICLLFAAAHGIWAQNMGPSPIGIYSAPARINAFASLSDHSFNAMVLGFNWGFTPRQVNTDLHINVVHVDHNLKWFDSPDDRILLNKLPNGTRLIYDPSHQFANTILDIGWRYWFIEDGINFDISLSHAITAMTEAVGIRFQPEIDVSGGGFNPRPNDSQGGIFGFKTKNLGTIPTSQADPNYQRFVLMRNASATPLTVLESAWPDNQLVEWEKDADALRNRPFNGRRLVLTINLRRIDLDPIDPNGDAEVLRIKLPYWLCSQENATAQSEYSKHTSKYICCKLIR